jgi:transglutaminase-like putative cysteine protease
LIATDSIVQATAREVVGGASTDAQKCRRIYDWVVTRTHREPSVRGCGVGDIKSMLETGNFGGKCADINGLFVGLCRASGIPARDLYGIRVAPSAFGYKELGGNPAQLQSAQHCRAEVFLRNHGWVAMDPADVCKVMRQETAQWIHDIADPLVAPVNAALYGGWEGNWLAFNTAADVELPGAKYGILGFLMYPQAENDNGRYDALDAEHFRYTISARELPTLG